MQHKIITTEDGSHTLFVPELNEHYHSVNGAIQESKHVFIDTGFKYFLEKNINQDDQKSINILEIGFGTGLNAFLTLIESQKLNVNVFYQSVELYPVSIKEAEKLNYFELINQSDIMGYYNNCTVVK
jgi:tRNA U34 5-methylaminomethyl-2-thiouridine-forming methyltransferase MnmC